MNQSRFGMNYFVLVRRPKIERGTFATDAEFADGFKTGEAPRCEACGRFIGLRPWLPPYRVILETWGKEFGDLAIFHFCDFMLVSERFKELWVHAGLVGLSGFFPTEVVKVKRHRKLIDDPPKYYKVDVIHNQSAIDYEASGYVWETQSPTCDVCRIAGGVIRWKGTVILKGTETDDDIFVPRAGSRIIISERFKSFCEQNQIKNATFAPAETYGHDFYPQISSG
jgi:hypothetical protein